MAVVVDVGEAVLVFGIGFGGGLLEIEQWGFAGAQCAVEALWLDAGDEAGDVIER